MDRQGRRSSQVIAHAWLLCCAMPFVKNLKANDNGQPLAVMLSYAQIYLKWYTALAIKTVAKFKISRQYTGMQRRRHKLHTRYILLILDLIVISSMHGGSIRKMCQFMDLSIFARTFA